MNVYKVQFESKPLESLEGAGPLFRKVVGIINPLAHSLLGREPLCAEELGLDLSRHQEVRRFKDVDGLLAFARHLDEVLEREANEELRPTFWPIFEDDGTVETLFYRTANKWAEIQLYKGTDGYWRITGSCRFRSVSHAVSKSLQANDIQYRIWRNDEAGFTA